MRNIFLNSVSNKQHKIYPPANYQKVDNFLSRSAQPNKLNIDWLQENNVTDIINFRRDNESFPLDFNEQKYVESKKMVYHNIPSYTNYPEEKNMGKFLDIVENVKKNGGKIHIHCREGADRTGMYAYIYERLIKLTSQVQAYKNFIDGGWHNLDHPHLANAAEDFVKKVIRK